MSLQTGTGSANDAMQKNTGSRPREPVFGAGRWTEIPVPGLNIDGNRFRYIGSGSPPPLGEGTGVEFLGTDDRFPHTV